MWISRRPLQHRSARAGEISVLPRCYRPASAAADSAAMELITHIKTAAATCALLALTTAPAIAGEITGKGKPTAGPTHANSICVFSGQNDDPTAPLSLDPAVAPNGPGGQSQSFGQDAKIGLEPRAFNPGMACGPGSNPDRLKQ